MSVRTGQWKRDLLRAKGGRSLTDVTRNLAYPNRRLTCHNNEMNGRFPLRTFNVESHSYLAGECSDLNRIILTPTARFIDAMTRLILVWHPYNSSAATI